MDIIGTLHRAPYSHTFTLVRYGYRAIVFNIELFLRSGFVFAFNDEIRVGPNSIDVSFVDQEFLEDVVFAPNDRFLRQ